jgi:hypothetical protein
MMKKQWHVVGAALSLGLLLCPLSAAGKSNDPSAAAKQAAEGAGQVQFSQAGNRGAPIFLLEEQHNSRLQQMQHALVMTRLHEKSGLVDVVLEGYLLDGNKVDLTPYRQMLRGLSPAQRAEIVVQLLKEGEISGAEFVGLVFDDVTLHPCEVKAQHGVTVSDQATKGMLGYLQAIARVDMPWVQKKLEIIKDEKKMLAIGTFGQKALYESIRDYAAKKSVAVSESDKKGMDEYLAFWTGRAKADQTMFDVARSVADSKGKSAVVMNIGALHTKRQSELCTQEKRPFAVITPLAKVTDNKRSDLTNAMYERKLEQRSVFGSGLSKTIEAGGHMKKPETVLAQEWFQTKSEIYSFVDRIAKHILAAQGGGANPPGSPPAPPVPPFGFGKDDFQGKWIMIDPSRLALAPADTNDKKNRAVLIPIVFKESGRTLWAKAALLQSKGTDTRSVETILRGALDAVENEAKTPESAESPTGAIQVGVDVTAGFAETVERARMIQLAGT